MTLITVSAIAADSMSFTIKTATKEWQGDYLTFDTLNNSFTFTYYNEDGSDGYANAAVSWLNGTAVDLSGYDSLVLSLQEASDADLEVVISDDGFWGSPSKTRTLTAGETRIALSLSDYADTSGIDLTKVNLIFLRTAWVHTQTVKIYSFCLTKSGVPSAISSLNGNLFSDNAAIYNLSGQKIEGSYKGLVIKNGKKYLLKQHFPKLR